MKNNLAAEASITIENNDEFDKKTRADKHNNIILTIKVSFKN